jgi:pyridoxine kinase
MGHPVWRLDTVTFSNHPGHGRFKGRVVPAGELTALLEGLDDLGVLGEAEGVLSGYLGSPETAEVVVRAVDRIRQLNPGMTYLCDPVIGDGGRVFVKPGVPEAIRDRLISLADIVTPNLFELGWLIGSTVDDLASVRRAAGLLRARGPHAVVVTGFPEGDTIMTLIYSRDGDFAVRAVLSQRAFNGTGDLIAALFLGHYLKTKSVVAALRGAASGMAEAIRATEIAGTKELQLIPALASIASPTHLLAVEPIP